MPDPRNRNFLRERGLGDEAPAPAPLPQFPFAIAGGEIVGAEASEQPPMPPGLPDDYAARLVAVEQGIRLMHEDGIDEVMGAVHRLHAFLTATERSAPAPKSHTFTDE